MRKEARGRRKRTEMDRKCREWAVRLRFDADSTPKKLIARADMDGRYFRWFRFNTVRYRYGTGLEMGLLDVGMMMGPEECARRILLSVSAP